MARKREQKGTFYPKMGLGGGRERLSWTDKMSLQQTDKAVLQQWLFRVKPGESIFCQGSTASTCLSNHPPPQPAMSHWRRAFISAFSAQSKAHLPSGVFWPLSAPCGGKGDMNIKVVWSRSRPRIRRSMKQSSSQWGEDNVHRGCNGHTRHFNANRAILIFIS